MRCCGRAKSGGSGVEASYILGPFTLPSGSWADWFSGLLSSITAAIAILGYFLSQSERRKADRQKDLELARAFGWKIIKCLNSNHDYYRHAWLESDKSLLGIDGEVQIHRSIFPMIGIEPDNSLEATDQEVGLLMKTRSSDLMHEYHLLNGRLRSVVLSLIEYKARYDHLQGMMPVPIGIVGNLVSTAMTREDMLKISPYAQQLEMIIRTVRQMTAENCVNAKKCLDMYDRDMKAHFGKSLFTFDHDPGLGNFDNIGVEIPRKN